MLQKDLREFVGLLNSHGVDYLIVGGHAVAYHGYPRYTGDVDFFIRPSPENAARVLAVLGDFGFGNTGVSISDLTTPERVIQMGLPPNRIDLLTSISGVSFEDAWAGRVADDLDGLPVLFLGREELLRNKQATGRTKDRDDLEKLGP
jgi:predicted nucleotidyltransferase